jgi:hypothetical protein
MFEMGQKVGHLTAVRPAGKRGGMSMWEFRCDCGSEGFITRATRVNCGVVVSCGCKRREGRKPTHGRSRTRIYGIWSLMKRRCSRPASDPLGCYYHKGVRVCEEWAAFEPFLAWSLANGYSDSLSIDRIDNDGPYSPENCRWATNAQQAANRSVTSRIVWEGQEYCAAQLERKVGTPLRSRLKLGWTLEDAIRVPVGGTHRYADLVAREER